jgi:hypothetical protein
MDAHYCYVNLLAKVLEIRKNLHELEVSNADKPL